MLQWGRDREVADSWVAPSKSMFTSGFNGAATARSRIAASIAGNRLATR